MEATPSPRMEKRIRGRGAETRSEDTAKLLVAERDNEATIL